ncbi:MAG: hypothetical protein OEX22_08240 [Cyclobacteriaceae bacterium]|nr:hypothetical protein [Cyclobacteriaceae bacterium]
MKKARLLTYVIFFAFHLGFLIVALLIDGILPDKPIDPDNFSDLGKLIPLLKYFNYIFIVKWVATIGIILVVIDFIIDFMEKSSFKSEINALKNELNATKAKMYDMQSASAKGKIDESPSAIVEETKESEE